MSLLILVSPFANPFTAVGQTLGGLLDDFSEIADLDFSIKMIHKIVLDKLARIEMQKALLRSQCADFPAFLDILLTLDPNFQASEEELQILFVTLGFNVSEGPNAATHAISIEDGKPQLTPWHEGMSLPMILHHVRERRYQDRGEYRHLQAMKAQAKDAQTLHPVAGGSGSR